MNISHESQEKINYTKRTIKDLVKIETDWLYSLINDVEWRESMWQLSYCPTKKTYMKRNTTMLTKRYWTTQKAIIEHIENCYWSQPSLYADCVKDMIHDKKATREIAKHIIKELKNL
jgi:hypothetical protein|tara:strand:- start:551 stop:901 length:351 start_codon:yes stop_codon:yes gene_type:complete